VGAILDSERFVTEIEVPEPPAGSRQSFLKFSLREAIDFPIVSVASVVTIDQGAAGM
jgi:CO/xanthine dehydrogenase FAD-binding subunit